MVSVENLGAYMDASIAFMIFGVGFTVYNLYLQYKQSRVKNISEQQKNIQEENLTVNKDILQELKIARRAREAEAAV